MPQDNFSTANLITLGIAIWGAFLSTFTLGWSVYRHFYEKGRLKVDCYMGVHVDALGNMSKSLFTLTITNIGNRSVIITVIGAEFPDYGLILSTTNRLPFRLESGEYIIEYFNDYSFLTNNVKSILVNDSLGKTYKAPKRRLKQAIKSAKMNLAIQKQI